MTTNQALIENLSNVASGRGDPVGPIAAFSPGVADVKQGVKKAPNTKRYNLVLPSDLYDDVLAAADSRQTTVVQILKQFIKIGLLVVDLENTPGSALIIREGKSEREIMMF